MSDAYYDIEANYAGDTHSLSFYSNGYIYDLDHAETSIAQVRAALEKKFSLKNSKFELVYISVNGSRKVIVHDYELENALEELENGASLSVNVVVSAGSKNKNKNNKNKNKSKKGKKNKQQQQSDSDSEEESDAVESDSESELNLTDYGTDSEYESDEPPQQKKKKNKNKNKNKNKGGPSNSGNNNNSKKINPAQVHKRFQEHVSSWDSIVPDAPLYREDDHCIRPENAQLQYLLTMTGDMPLGATSVQTGSYQSNTENAVEAFRERHGVYDNQYGMDVYDEYVKRKLEQVVKKMRKDGNQYV